MRHVLEEYHLCYLLTAYQGLVTLLMDYLLSTLITSGNIYFSFLLLANLIKIGVKLFIQWIFVNYYKR